MEESKESMFSVLFQAVDYRRTTILAKDFTTDFLGTFIFTASQ